MFSIAIALLVSNIRSTRIIRHLLTMLTSTGSSAPLAAHFYHQKMFCPSPKSSVFDFSEMLVIDTSLEYMYHQERAASRQRPQMTPMITTEPPPMDSITTEEEDANSLSSISFFENLDHQEAFFHQQERSIFDSFWKKIQEQEEHSPPFPQQPQQQDTAAIALPGPKRSIFDSYWSKTGQEPLLFQRESTNNEASLDAPRNLCQKITIRSGTGTVRLIQAADNNHGDDEDT